MIRHRVASPARKLRGVTDPRLWHTVITRKLSLQVAHADEPETKLLLTMIGDAALDALVKPASSPEHKDAVRFLRSNAFERVMTDLDLSTEWFWDLMTKAARECFGEDEDLEERAA